MATTPKMNLPAGYTAPFERSDGAENSAWVLKDPTGAKTPLSLEVSEEGVYGVSWCKELPDDKIELKFIGRDTLNFATAVRTFEREAAKYAADARTPVEA